jgi:small subunit ribosomal protein S6
LTSPNLGKPELSSFKAKIDGILANGQGQIVRFEDWGRRRLAYPVKKEIYGNYFLYDYQGLPALASELERNLKIDEQVFKFLTLVLEKDFDDRRYEETVAQLAKEAQKKEGEKAPAGPAPDVLKEYMADVADASDSNPDFVEDQPPEPETPNS